jgi:hypothetical protein
MRARSVGFNACLLSVAALNACGPHINQFRAEPSVVCPGEPVVLSWNASAQGTLSAVPAETGLGSVPASGCTHAAPRQRTRYTFKVQTLFGSDQRQVDVDTQTPGEVKDLGASVADPSTTCEGGKLSVTVRAPGEYWSPGLTVVRVQLPAEVNREILVQHRGHTGLIGERSRETHEFDGLSPSGVWRLTTSLAASETCGTPTIPHSVFISVSLGCAE